MSESEDALSSMMTVAEVAHLVWNLYQRTGGATVSMFSGDLSGQELYAVSIFGDRTQIIENAVISLEMIEAFIRANLDLLADTKHAVGVWLEIADDQTFLDVSITVQDHNQAIRLAQEHSELAICHLKDLTVEYIEGG